MRILFIDDEPIMRGTLCAFLTDKNYDVDEAGNGKEGLDILRASPGEIEAVVVDLNMPELDGYEFIRLAVELVPELPIIVLSGVDRVEDALRAMRLGAWDFITKPLKNIEVLVRSLDRVTEMARLRRENRLYHENLEMLVKKRTAELEDVRRQVMQRLSRAAEFKDNATGKHVIRVGKTSGLLAKGLGMDQRLCDLLTECAPLHDIGKIGIPDDVLLKRGRLTEEEWVIIRRHCIYGCEILGPLESRHVAQHVCEDAVNSGLAEPNVYLKLSQTVALFHHEKWDGSGYPFGLKGEDIPTEARIVAVADVFDALATARSYKPALPYEKCMEIIREGSGSHFDPTVVDVFFEHIDEIMAIMEEWKETVEDGNHPE